MNRWIAAGALLTAGIWLAPNSAEASGSIGTGAGKVSPRAAYSQGKALTFDTMVCNDCPLQKGDLDRDRAQSLTASLQAVYDGGQAQSGDSGAISALCGGSAASDADCRLRMELVHYFLSRRYRL